LQFAKSLSKSFPAEVLTDIKCLVLQEKLILQSIGTPLAKGNLRRVVSRG